MSGRLADALVLDVRTPLSIVIFGATGDLARNKLFPALYQLLYGCPDAPLLPRSARIIGVGRSQVKLSAFLDKQCAHVKGSHLEEFRRQISYFQGKYDSEEDFGRLHKALCELEDGGACANRLFFLSVPPAVFGCVCENIHRQARSIGGYTRLIIEKPFGRDSRTFAELDASTSGFFEETQLFRIDHYLAKEKVLNLLAMRFANQLYEPLWNSRYIEQVQIIFKEDIGTGGRGGYFDDIGIIRDVMQNHLLQVFLWLAMEPPERLDAESIAIEKCKLLKATRTIQMSECFLGQYAANSWTVNGQEHTEPGYLDDETVPPGSRCATFAAVALHVDNERWRDVPFLMSAGKGLDDRLAEVRVTFKKQGYNSLIPGQPNELIIRIQPDEGIYLRCTNKHPGWNQDGVSPVQLDMSYKRAFPGSYVAGAYERVFLNAARGDQSLFVGSGELVEAWRVFTPLLDEIDQSKPQPVIYPFGSHSPPGLRDFAKKHNVTVEECAARDEKQIWKKEDRSHRSGNSPAAPSAVKAAGEAVVPVLKSIKLGKNPRQGNGKAQLKPAVVPVLLAFFFGVTFSFCMPMFVNGS